MKIVLETLGCKLNQAETESLARRLTGAGYRLVESVDEADIYIINTCTVTGSADAKSRHLLRLAHRRNPNVRLVAIGCYAQRAANELSGLEWVKLVAGNDEKSSLPSLLDELECKSDFCSTREQLVGSKTPLSRTRSFIKIQDGCNKFCSYCIVPLVRGTEKSQPADRIISEIKEQVTGGVKEVVLTGTEVGAYEDNGVSLKGLLERILAETATARIRLSSLQPQEISPGLIGLWSDERLCPHFHLSLQSGSDSVLKRMKRGYTVGGYQWAVSLIRSRVPDVAITTDIITGFPGESTAEFEESLNFCRQMEFARIHVFPYSPRPGTKAAASRVQVADRVRKQRNQILLALAEESASNFMQKFSGRTMPVLWEHKSGGIWPGHTGNYIRVYTKSDDDLFNRLLPVSLVEIRGDGMWGSLLETHDTGRK